MLGYCIFLHFININIQQTILNWINLICKPVEEPHERCYLFITSMILEGSCGFSPFQALNWFWMFIFLHFCSFCVFDNHSIDVINLHDWHILSINEIHLSIWYRWMSRSSFHCHYSGTYMYEISRSQVSTTNYVQSIHVHRKKQIDVALVLQNFNCRTVLTI